MTNLNCLVFCCIVYLYFYYTNLVLNLQLSTIIISIYINFVLLILLNMHLFYVPENDIDRFGPT